MNLSLVEGESKIGGNFKILAMDGSARLCKLMLKEPVHRHALAGLTFLFLTLFLGILILFRLQLIRSTACFCERKPKVASTLLFVHYYYFGSFVSGF